MIPHLRVHGGRDEHRLVGGKQHRRGKIVGAAFGHAGEDIGGRRRDHDQVGLARKADVPDVVLVLPVEESVNTLLPVIAPTASGVTNCFRRRGQDRVHIGAALAQPPDQVERFVEGDPAGDDEEDALRAEHRVHAVQRVYDVDAHVLEIRRRSSWRAAIPFARAVAAIIMSSFSYDSPVFRRRVIASA